MKTFKVNADYESVLFRGQIGSPALNHTLEFLYLFLEDDCLLTDKNYSTDYLEYIEKLTGKKPNITKTASKTFNWWGLQENIEIERWWNSKITTVEFLKTKNWVQDLHLIKTDKDLSELDSRKDYLIKDPFLMSGQRFQTSRGKITWNQEHLLIAEPLLKRIKDFSTYVYPDGRAIFYENVVDNKFQYKGSLFSHIKAPLLDQLSFYHELESFQWDNFKSQLAEILSHYSRYPNQVGFSIDSFIYQDEGLHIYPLCEVNYRRTMGRIAYELGLKFGGDKPFVGFFLAKTGNKPLWKKLRDKKDVIVFSPGDSRFEMFMICANSKEDAEKLLANTQAAIDL
jgi:hypothetical protein